MRRGHPGIGGWRNENPRHFRPRNGGNQHFRPSRSYSLLDQHRFPPPGPRPSLPHTTPLPGYKHRSGDDGYIRHDYHDKGKYRSSYRQNNYPRNHEESHQHQEQPKMYPSSRQNRSTENIYKSSTYPKEPSNYYEDSSKNCHTNSMGDIDHRYAPSRVSGVRQYPIPVWGNDSNRAPFDERGHKYVHLKSHTYEVSESSKLPQYDYTGHRPPSSDHYGGNPTPVINNSGSFNRSVDDTVDLIRKRLLNRNDPQIEENDSSFTHNTDERIEENVKESVQNFHHHQQPAKKRIQRQRQSEKSSSGASFTKIKSKIVNQLFKMDKEKIHKLMDNPNSSLKFEYAISSLITESQYSFNRHLRSVAEKSLHTSNSSSSIDFMQNDNNTIYEDTFMKQMQCILDPQDTVLLEDIKPIVMAELSKALQLDEYEQGIEVANDEFQHHDNLHEYNQSDYSNEYCDDNLYTYDDYSQYPDIQEQKPMQFDRRHIEAQKSSDRDYDKNQEYDSSETFVERKPVCRRNSHNLNLEREETIVSPQYPRKSLDERLSELFTAKAHSEPETPMFDTKPVNQQIYLPNTEPLDDDDEEDQFAELDKQYHVAVDHSFIDNDDSSSVHLEKDNILPEKEGTQPKSPKPNKNIMVSITTPEKERIDEEIDHQLQDMANSLLKFPTYVNNNTESPIKERNTSLTVVKPEPCDSTLNNISVIEKPTCTKSIKEIESNEEEKEFPKLETSQIITKSTVVSTSRKRSIDQSPSHRKEKRKKNDSAHQDYEKPISNQGTSIHTNEPKTPKKASKIHVPEKHNKRKESHKKTNEKDNKFNKKLNSSDSLNSSISSSESNNTITSNNKPNIKSDTKSTLKTFDIFTEQPKKVIVQKAHRNTAVATVCNIKNIEEPKTQQAAKITKRNASSTQVVKKFHSIHVQTIEPRTKCTRFSQTDRKRQISKATQTEAVPSSSSALIKKELKISADPLERMKEIDMEIQVLLQEKFKLYSSIESKESGKNSLHSLGMAVLNVSPCEEEAKNNVAEMEIKSEENCVTEDSIVEDFTSIPMEELQNIAFEAIEEKEMEDDQSQGPGIRKMRLRALSKEKSKSQSPTPSIQTKNYKKRKSPNISLIEKIITDERPIEEIISLGDLEVTSVPKSRKTTKSKKKAKKKSTAISMAETLPASANFVLKNCTVKLLREDLSKYLSSTVSDKLPIENKVSPLPVSQNNIEFWENTQPSTLVLPTLAKEQELPINITIIEPQPTSSAEPVNDIHFDMLDVSEDIEIGDICEVKCIEDKIECTTIELPITEDIILDNSQPSIEEQGLSSDPKENVCKMFDYSADETLRRDSVVVTGNADAVLAIECIENNFIAACLDGNVYYFSADGQLITTLRGSNLAVTCLTIVKEKYSTTVYTGSLDSRIRFYDLDTGLEKGPECNVLSPIQTMDRAWDTVFVGTRTGFVLQFECKNNMLIPISTVQFSEQSILALRALKEGPRKVLLVAARSEDVTIKDAQTGLLLRTLVGPKMTVYTLLYEDGKIYCGTSSSQIHVFDYSSGGHVGAHEGGKGAVCLRASGGLVFAGCYDGCVYVYREGERRPFAQLRGPSPMLLSLALVGSKIIAGYKDRSLYIWKIPLSILQEMIL